MSDDAAKLPAEIRPWPNMAASDRSFLMVFNEEVRQGEHPTWEAFTARVEKVDRQRVMATYMREFKARVMFFWLRDWTRGEKWAALVERVGEECAEEVVAQRCALAVRTYRADLEALYDTVKWAFESEPVA